MGSCLLREFGLGLKPITWLHKKSPKTTFPYYFTKWTSKPMPSLIHRLRHTIHMDLLHRLDFMTHNHWLLGLGPMAHVFSFSNNWVLFQIALIYTNYFRVNCTFYTVTIGYFNPSSTLQPTDIPFFSFFFFFSFLNFEGSTSSFHYGLVMGSLRTYINRSF